MSFIFTALRIKPESCSIYYKQKNPGNFSIAGTF